MKIGILSDTHDLLRPEVITALQGCESILHAGDISSPGILDRLSQIAPVKAVRGNNEKGGTESLPLFLDFELAGLRVFMTHKKKDLPKDCSAYGLMICGHSHQYAEAWAGHTLLLNPGSCGPRRFHQPITLAILETDGQDLCVTRVDIPHTPKETAPKIESGNIKAQIELVMKETQKGRGPKEIAQRSGLDPALTEQIARLYVTHPGVTADGIMTKMGL
ncbi:MAG: metallophosphoesterase family protein [Clostridia bacterium]|nr:metallophosphoesterase family protein [Clostridia bacterium]MBQ6962066.1 metallophosphoesterase family protein [Clostridia bacterium]